jgi:hypothetical protein
MTKRNDIGRVIGQVGGFRIRQKSNMTPGANVKVRKVVSTEIGIFKGKKMVESGFKSKAEAMERAKSL